MSGGWEEKVENTLTPTLLRARVCGLLLRVFVHTPPPPLVHTAPPLTLTCAARLPPAPHLKPPLFRVPGPRRQHPQLPSAADRLPPPHPAPAHGLLPAPLPAGLRRPPLPQHALPVPPSPPLHHHLHHHELRHQREGFPLSRRRRLLHPPRRVPPGLLQCPRDHSLFRSLRPPRRALPPPLQARRGAPVEHLHLLVYSRLRRLRPLPAHRLRHAPRLRPDLARLHYPHDPVPHRP